MLYSSGSVKCIRPRSPWYSRYRVSDTDLVEHNVPWSSGFDQETYFITDIFSLPHPHSSTSAMEFKNRGDNSFDTIYIYIFLYLKKNCKSQTCPRWYNIIQGFNKSCSRINSLHPNTSLDKLPCLSLFRETLGGEECLRVSLHKPTPYCIWRFKVRHVFEKHAYTLF